MGVENKKVRIDISLEAADALKEINRLNDELDKLTVELGNVAKGTKEYDDINKRLVSTQNQLNNTTKTNTNSINANASSHSNSTNAINAEIQRLQALQRTLDVTSKEYAETTAAISLQSNKMNQATAATGGTTSAALELGRVISDAPYGIRGVANNLSQFTNMMFHATEKAGSLSKAIGGLFSSLMGPLGIILAIQTAIALLDHFSGGMKKAEEQAEGLSKGISSLAEKLDELGLSELAVNQRIEDYVKLSRIRAELDAKKVKSDEKQAEISKRLVEIEEEKATALELANANQKKYDEIGGAGYLKGVSDNQAIYNKLLVEENKLVDEQTAIVVESVDAWNDYKKAKDKITESDANTLAGLNRQKSALQTLQKNVSRTSHTFKEYAEEIKEVQDKIDAITGGGNKSGSTKKNRSNASFKESNIQLEKDAQKHYNNMLQLLITEEDKQLEAKQKAEREELDAQVALFVKEEEISYNAYVKKQEQRILDNANNKFIVDDANRLIAEAKVTHDGVIEESEAQHQATMTNLKGVQAVESIKLTNKLAEDKEEHNRRMRDLDLELSAIVFEDGKVFQRYILDEQIANQEADLEVLQSKLDSTAYMESLSYDERLALKEKFNEESLALEEMNAARSMSIEEAKQSMTEATWELATKGMMSASKLAKKGSDEEKALALLSIAAGTAEGLINGIVIAGNTAKASPGPAAPFIYGAMVAAQTASVLGAAAQAKSILNGGSASSSSAASSSATVESFSPNFNVVGNSNENQLAQSISNQTNSPVQAYVVYEDIAEAESVTQQSIESSGI